MIAERYWTEQPWLVAAALTATLLAIGAWSMQQVMVLQAHFQSSIPSAKGGAAQRGADESSDDESDDDVNSAGDTSTSNSVPPSTSSPPLKPPSVDAACQ